LPALVIRRFCSDSDSILDPSSTGGPIWCHVLPSSLSLLNRTLFNIRSSDPLKYVHVKVRVHREAFKKSPFLPQVLSRDQINLTHSISTRPILTQLPEPPLSQPLSSFSSRLEPPRIPLSQQGGAEELLGKQFWNTVRQSGEDWSSSSHSSNSQNLYQLDHSPSGSSFYQHFQPASSLPVPPPHALPSPVPVSPKLVPIFRNKEPSHRINVALLRAQKQEQLSGRREDKPRITLPVTAGWKTAVPAASSSFSAVSLPLPPRIVPRFNHRPKNLSSSISQPSGRPMVNHISSLSPISRVKPVVIIPSKSKTRFSKTPEKVGPERNTEPWKTLDRTAGSESIVPKTIMKTSREAETNRPPLTSGNISTKDTSISRKNVSPHSLN
ncbi:hypothetical protein XENOCAPTIV_024482, partial [Xenoophorus captivus]